MNFAEDWTKASGVQRDREVYLSKRRSNAGPQFLIDAREDSSTSCLAIGKILLHHAVRIRREYLSLGVQTPRLCCDAFAK